MEALLVLWDGLRASIGAVLQIGLIAIPIMVLIEFAKTYNWIERITFLTKPITRLLNLSEHAILPLTVGLTFGLILGAGVLIQTAREGNISLRDLFLLNVFLSICHGVIEETMVFVALGINGLLLVGLRFSIALLTTLIVARFFYRNPAEIPQVIRG
ncbi:MAG: nucleoside recognition protein [Firmicutes bacterium]|nr:nucleoside recognition protein [Bacillota bacterium]